MLHFSSVSDGDGSLEAGTDPRLCNNNQMKRVRVCRSAARFCSQCVAGPEVVDLNQQEFKRCRITDTAKWLQQLNKTILLHFNKQARRTIITMEALKSQKVLFFCSCAHKLITRYQIFKCTHSDATGSVPHDGANSANRVLIWETAGIKSWLGGVWQLTRAAAAFLAVGGSWQELPEVLHAFLRSASAACRVHVPCLWHKQRCLCHHIY